MKKLCSLACLLWLTAAGVQAQYNRLIVRLADKKGTLYSLSDPSAYLSAKAIERRTKQKINIDSTDLPISAAYLDSIRKVPNVTILNVSKWLNQVLIKTSDLNAVAKINAYPFVKITSAVAPRVVQGSDRSHKLEDDPTPLTGNRTTDINGITTLNYGNTYNQIHIHEGEYLHDRGFTGRGITIAVLDAGFNGYKTNTAVDSVRLQGRVLGEWDFVASEASVNEDDAHGLYCFSIMASNKPGQLVGSAPHASFWLFRTEDAATEFPVEEQNWAAAAERADSAGVDMISSSLGYSDFDNHAFDHSYAQRDGNTAMITIAADLAAHKGILVVNSAGNEGALTSDLKFVACPADGDSVLTVGATDVNGNIANFSSWGPNGKGTLKPNVVSVGVGTVYVSIGGNVASGNGTSFSTPNLCGLIACLWQAFPEFTNMQIIDAVQKSADKFSNPDNRFGYGLPNFRKAFEILQQQRNLNNPGAVLGNDWIKAYPVPFHNQFSIMVKAPATGRAFVRLTDAAGKLVDQRLIDVTAGQVYTVTFSRAVTLATGAYFVQYSDGGNKQTIPVMKH